MKTFLVESVAILSLSLLLTQCETKSDPITETLPEPEVINKRVVIPDIAFLDALTKLGVDTNGDGVIYTDEAEAVTSLDIRGEHITQGHYSGMGISSINGIEAFINLDSLKCEGNEIESINLIYNTKLRYLQCRSNNLHSLNISNSTLLEYLDCSYNQLSELNVNGSPELVYLDLEDNKVKDLELSNNTKLQVLNASDNRLFDIDLSMNTSLESIGFGHCYLSTLDISHNRNLKFIFIADMPNLKEVCVWRLPFPPAGVELRGSSTDITFTKYCSQQ